MLLDICDTLQVWCIGSIKEIIKRPSQPKDLLLVSYLGWNSALNEFIPAGSRRLAALGTFTRLTDIPRYRIGRNFSVREGEASGRSGANLN